MFKEKLEQLNEQCVLNIFSAYEELPKEFPNDLLEEIKEMVLVTIQHNSSNIKTAFLLEFLERHSRLSRNRRYSESKLVQIFNEVQNRLPHDDFLQRPKNIT